MPQLPQIDSVKAPDKIVAQATRARRFPWLNIPFILVVALLVSYGLVVVMSAVANDRDYSFTNQLAGVDDVFNAVLMKGDMLGDVVFYGKGAGKLPTASAVVADVIDALKEGVKVHDSLFWKPAEKPEGLLEDRNTYPWYLRVTGVAAALLPSVAGAGHVVFEDNAEAAYLVDAATSADIAAVTEKIEVLGGKVALAMKKLED